jgi:hypothetical protein
MNRTEDRIDRNLEHRADHATDALASDVHELKARGEHAALVAAPIARALTVLFTGAIALAAIGLLRRFGHRR